MFYVLSIHYLRIHSRSCLQPNSIKLIEYHLIYSVTWFTVTVESSPSHLKSESQISAKEP